MAATITPAERKVKLSNVAKYLAELNSFNRQIDVLEKKAEDALEHAGLLSDIVENIIEAAEATAARLSALVTDTSTWLHKWVIRPIPESALPYLKVLDNDGSDHGVIDGGTGLMQQPFKMLVAGDTISITNAEDPTNNGTYTVHAVNGSGTDIELTEALAESNTDDETITITLMGRS